MKKVVSLLLSAALLTGIGIPAAQALPAEAADGPVYLAQTADGVVTEEIGDIRVQILSPTLVRIEQKGPKGFEDRNTFHISNRTDWLGDTVQRTEEDGNVVLTTSAYRVVVPGRGEDISQVEVQDLAGNTLWQYSPIDTNKVALPDLTEYVEAWAIADTPRVVPAEWGFTEQPEDNQENRDTNGWDLSNDAEDYYVFLPAGDHKQLRKDFVSLTGRTEMIPLSALGAWDSRYYAYNEETALQQIEGYHSRNLPLDNLVIDTDWRDSSGGTGYNINTSLFPDMERFFEEAHAKNVNIIFNDHPEPTQTNGQNNNVLNAAEITYRQQNLQRILNMGLDGWWYDRNWWTTIVPIDGFTHEVMGMATYADAFKAVYPERRLFMMSNVDGVRNGTREGASNIAAHRYSIQWTGDTSGGQETIWQEVANTLDMGAISALPYVSTDLGAHNTHDASMTNSEYLRWMQFGALSPIFRPHVSNVKELDDGRMPWVRGEETTDIYRDFLNLRYRLLPTFYQLSHENYETGMPLLHSLAFDYPEYDGADTSDQYMLGEDILVAPVVDGADQGIVPAAWFTDLQAEYYNNSNLEGSPVLTEDIENINFNWGDGSPAASVPADNFRIRFSGSITIGSEKDTLLSLLCDDGCRLYIDDELVIDAWVPQDSVRLTTEESYEAGSTHTFRLEYYEEAYSALCQLSSRMDTTDSAPRTVWIPEGEWIDTLTGETVYGPQTIEVSCAVDEYPIFIKKGAIIPLADETLTTADSDWSHLTLDVYPSTRQSDVTELYEDDTTSTAYQEGEYRTTQLSSYFDSEAGEAIVEIGAAQGDFAGELAFDSRDWTLRIHQPEGWGELEAVLVDGEEADFTATAADSEAMPLMNEGGSRDGTVYTLQFTADVADAKTVRLQFANPADPAVPADDYDTPNYYGRPAPVEVTRDIQVEETVPEQVNLTEEGSADWVHAGYGETLATVRKAGVEPKITFRDAATPLLMYDYRAHMSWTDGDIQASETGTQTGSHNKTVNDGYEIIVNAGPGEQTLVLYLGGWHSTARMEVFDETGGEVQTYEWSNASDSFYRRVTIQFSSQYPSDLHVKYSLVSGDNNVFVAAALSGDPGSVTKNALYMNAGSYRSDTWTNKDVKIGLSAALPEEVEKYQVKVNDADWADLDSGDYRVTEDGVYNLQFRYVDVDGAESPAQSITVKRDGTAPDLTVERAGDTFTASATEGLTGSKIYYRVDGGMWNLYTDAVDIAQSGGSIYRFKAVSGAGLESPVQAFLVETAPARPAFTVGVDGVVGQPTDQPVTFTLTLTAGDAASVTFYYAMDGGEWTALDGNTLTVSEADGVEYRFKAVDASGLESDVSDAYLLHITGGDILLGDVNGDGSINIQDVMAACRILARNNTGTEPSAEELSRADMNGDKAVLIDDIMAICKLLARNS